MRRLSAPCALAAGLAILAGAAAAAPAENPPKKIYTTRHVNPRSPVIDGRLDDEAWAKVAWESGFVQHEPVEGAAPTEQTEFKVVYDDAHLFVAIRARDAAPAGVERRISRRDDAAGDQVGVIIDSYFDHQTGFGFSVNAAGVKSDELYTNNGSGEPDKSWDPIWDVAARVDDEGWTAEMRIPFSQLRFAAKPDQIWGFEVIREYFRKTETSIWQPIPRNAPGIIHLLGELHGLKDLQPPHQVELMPYAVGKAQTFRTVPGNPFATGDRQGLYGGLDGKAGVTSDLTLNFTLNPDFGQVEADPSVVNLTAFETYFEEKRPFFIEGRNLLSFQTMMGDGDMSSDNLFYTRRIGRAPQGGIDAGPGGFVDMPEAAAILGAFKLTGKTRRGLSIGLLESVTGEEEARVFSGGIRDERAVEPLTNYFGLKIQQDYRQGATVIGGMITATNRSTKSEALRFLHDGAYSGGFSLTHSWRNRTYALNIRAFFSRVEGTPDAIARTQRSPLRYYQRPDADYLRYDPARTSLSGHGGTVTFGKEGGGRLMFVVGATWRSPGLELNDMGYLRQADEIMEFVWAGYRFYKPFALFREMGLNFNQWRGWNFGGENIYDGGNVNFWGQFKNYWEFNGGLNRNMESLSPSALRGGPSLRSPGQWTGWLGVETDSRKKIRFEASVEGSRRDAGAGRRDEIDAGISIQPSRALNVSLKPSWETNRAELQYVATRDAGGEARYLFGAIDQTTVALTIRLNYSLTPDLSVQFYGQPFLSAGAYSRFKAITAPRAEAFTDRFHVFGPGEIVFDPAAGAYTVSEPGRPAYGFGNPDFNVFEFRSNLVLRWEYVPGSTLYLVWSQGRSGFLANGDFDFRRGVTDLFDLHPHSVFLVKFSYCFQL